MSKPLPNNQRQRSTCYALCHILYSVSAAHTGIFFRMDSNSWRMEEHTPHHRFAPTQPRPISLCILVYLVVYNCGSVFLELFLFSWYPSQRGPFQSQAFRYNLSGANLISPPLPGCRSRACQAAPFHRSAAEREGNEFKQIKGFHLEAKARICL